MRSVRPVALAMAMVLVLGAAGSVSAAPVGVTFHGTFSSGAAYSSLAPGEELFTMPLRGTWNLDMNSVRDDANATLIVKMLGGGLHARWTEGQLSFSPLTAPSAVGDVVPAAKGVVNDPAHGIHAYTSPMAYRHGTLIVVLDERSGTFFYAAAPGDGYGCTPDAEGCYDAVYVAGSAR